jgi:branched-chain amino acid transport system permease protein
MAIGGYFAAYMVRDMAWPFWLALITAIIVGAIVGYLPALGLAGTSGLATGMASTALIFIIQSVISNLHFLGGSTGFANMPQVNYLLPISCFCVLIVGIIIYRIEHSRIGRAMEAIREDPNLAASMGVNIKATNMFSITTSSAIGALAGVLFAFNLGAIYPDTFSFGLLLSTSTMMFIGGRYTMWGPVIAAPILYGLPQWLPHWATSYGNYILGVLLIIVLMVRPQGVITRGLVRRIVKGVKFTFASSRRSNPKT